MHGTAQIAQPTTEARTTRYASAYISPCGQYRYRLTRIWNEGDPADYPRPFMLPIVMLNPSTADERLDDPTIRRCIGFAKREGYLGLMVANLFALRATNPGELQRAANPFGPDNEHALDYVLDYAQCRRIPVLCAWGANSMAIGQAERFKRIARMTETKLACLGTTNSGAPRHPLYVNGAQPLEDFA